MKKPCLSLIYGILVTGLALVPASAWVSSTPGPADSTPAHWDLSDQGTNQQEISGGRITYRLHNLGSDDVGDGTDLEALRRAFQTWANVSGSELEYQEGTILTDRSIDNDGAFSVFWDEAGQFPLSGALAVTFTYIFTSGPETGEIVDTNIVFNGGYTWATDGRTGAYDIESVAIHEIGHSFGLDHSPAGSSTLWPFTGSGETFLRSPSSDDMAAVRAKYADTATLTGTGSIEGYVTRSGGGLLHGAHVAALDAQGNLVASTLSLADGSYRLEPLPPGTYSLAVETLGTSRFAIGNLGPYYSGADSGFAAAPEVPGIQVNPGLVTTQDLLTPSGSPTMQARWFGRTDENRWRSSAVQVQAGEGLVELGMAAEGLPMVGDPLRISGTDLPVVSTRFATVGGVPAALITVDVASDTEPGSRTLILETSGEVVYGIGVLEILPANPRDDSDGDGIYDDDEGAPNVDTDGDGVPDYLDLDSDADGILDAEEAGDSDPDTLPVDTDLDGVRDFRDIDSDADLILDRHEAGDPDLGTTALDTDSDGLPDYRDADSDNDTVLDVWESGDLDPSTPPVDTDADFVPDFRDPDSDNDGLADALESGDANIATDPVDTDSDGIEDLHDLDSDDDGVNDGTLHEDTSDFDGDGLANFRDPDSDDGGETDGSEIQNNRNPLDASDDNGGSLPGEVPDGTGGTQPMRVQRLGATGLTLSWSAAAGADSYRVYRGTLSTLNAGVWDLTSTPGAGSCDTLGQQEFTDAQEVGDGMAYFYLVAGLNNRGEGGLGNGSGTSRPIGPGCSP